MSSGHITRARCRSPSAGEYVIDLTISVANAVERVKKRKGREMDVVDAVAGE
jgi:hypothetical protein